MKRILISFCLYFIGSLFLWSINICQVEYYIDTDPGLGLVTQVPITQAADINTSFEVNLQNVSDGLHILSIRIKDANGKWSLLNSKFIFKQSSLNTPITYLEYFFDTDPGYHNGFALNFTGSSDILCAESIPITQLTNGLHILYIRCCDAKGFWSQNYSKLLYKITPGISPVTYAEMFFDNDPGHGYGIPLTLQTSEPNVYEINFNLTDANVIPGIHLLGVRVENNSGYWSMNEYKFIYLSSFVQPEIRKVCWYFTGSGANPNEIFTYEITNPATDITLALEASLIHLQQDGNYQMVMYCTNSRGQMSMYEYKTFIADFSPNNVILTIGETSLTLTWDEVVGADHYLVTQKDNPYQQDGTVYTVDSNILTLPIAQKGFFNVKAQKDSKYNLFKILHYEKK